MPLLLDSPLANPGPERLRESRPRRRVGLLTNIPAPYRLELFKQINRRHDVKLFFDSASEPNRSWALPDTFGFPHQYLQSRAISFSRHKPGVVLQEQRFRQLSWDLIPSLRRFRPDVVVSAELGPRTLQACAYCALTGKPLVIWWEGTQHTEGWVGKRKAALRTYLIRRAARFWSNGQESSELLRSYGAKAAQIDEAMMCTDTEWLASETERSLSAREELRCRLKLRGVVFLFVGRFTKQKGVVLFLDALEKLAAATTADFSALFVGEGPDQDQLEEWRRSHPAIRVAVVGFQQPHALPAYYGAGDVFVLPTLEDNWSLVALEAATAGLPQVFSSYNGASSDLLGWGAEGVIVDPLGPGELTAALQRFAENPPPRTPESQRTAMIRFYGAAACAERAARSIDLCCRQSAGERLSQAV